MALISGRPRPRVLVLRALGLGDLLTAVPALRALRRGYPEHLLTLATPPWLAPLLPLIGAADELHPTAGLPDFRWSAAPPDLAVNLHGRGPQSLEALRSSGAPQILSHRHEQFALDGPEWDPGQHEVIRWCRLLDWAGVTADPTDLELAQPATSSTGPAGAVVIHPGAAAPARRWPVGRFAAVAAELAGRGHRVVVTGSAAETALAVELADLAGLPRDAVTAGALALDDLASLISRARLVVSGDTGVGHLASAYNTPSVLLFGPTSPARWGPPAGPHRVLWKGTEGDPHGARIDPGLLAIGVPDVLAAAYAALERPGSASRKQSQVAGSRT